MKKQMYLFFSCIIALSVSCKDQSSTNDVVNGNSPELIDKNDIERIEPPNWWIGFENDKLQLLVKHNNIAEYTPSISYKGVSIEKVNKGDNSNNYLFIDLLISETASAGTFNIKFKNGSGDELIHTYQLKNRLKPAEDFIGFDSSDAVFLITPDRFSNGDPSNDIVEGLKQTSIDRTDGYARHGGDLRGIINNIDYIHDLGYTAVWPTPVLINDMPQGSYHGYAITDYHKVDPRFGTLEEYKELSAKLREKSMMLIMDQVANHCGLEHWWMKDLPFKDWVNNQKNYEDNIENWNWKVTTFSNHRRTTNQDLYASNADRKGNTDGWFVEGMPDLNQRNPFLATYIIQNSIWWIETLELGGIRQDTYPYPDKDFMANWAGSIMKEYPNFSIVGEEWSYNPLLVGYWQTGNNNKDGYESNLKSTMDFPMTKAIKDGINEEESWDKGLVKLYEGLANDFSYANPNDIMIFMGNHDKSRVYTEFGEDAVKTKMALSYMLMLPRIPQIYYGTEILMDDTAIPGDHGLIRTDFPGGWEGDTVNAFTGEGLSIEQKEMQSFMSKLLNYRKNSKAIHDGKTVHFSPFMGTYFLFRTLGNETVVLIINKNDEPITIDLKRYTEIGLDGKTLTNIITGETFDWNDAIDLSVKGPLLLTTKTE
ncbi:glycoside hydrolase family 13 protein [Psychroserpens luteolus]|uniref:glycoside hydrolase family 13 protein n=1 Tax=Psychroserpens luteolus TaxID=2855840 RepID=UPI001E478396|nr:glycoside hydrolase family 13 protein [Psychroserpens luteolus]MCD2257815.1 glycoside hydrolase family 13 protein [Psychroserpens luteolus]